MSEDCIFCKIVAGELPSDQLYQDELVTAFRDISAQAPVHLLIVPNRHFRDLGEMGDEQAELMGRIAQVAGAVGRAGGCRLRRLAFRHQHRPVWRSGSLPYALSPAGRATARASPGALSR